MMVINNCLRNKLTTDIVSSHFTQSKAIKLLRRKFLLRRKETETLLRREENKGTRFIETDDDDRCCI